MQYEQKLHIIKHSVFLKNNIWKQVQCYRLVSAAWLQCFHTFWPCVNMKVSIRLELSSVMKCHRLSREGKCKMIHDV